MAESPTQRIVDDLHLDRRGGPRPDKTVTRPWSEGTWMRLSSGDDVHSALTLVTGPDQAVSILALGSVAENTARHDRWFDANTELTRTTHPPIVIKLHGQHRTFAAAAGGWLVGKAAVADTIALLGHDGALVLVLVGDGERFELRASLKPSSIPQVIDLDAPPATKPRRAAPSRRPTFRLASPASPGAALAHHDRILAAIPPRSDEGRARIDQILAAALAELALEAELRACKLSPTDRACIARGPRYVPAVLDVLCRMKRNHFGTGRALYRIFRDFDDETISMSEHDFVCALGLLRAVGTCLVTRPRGKLWGVLGEGIDDPQSPLHLQLCKETRTGAGRSVVLGDGADEVAVADAPLDDEDTEAPEVDDEHHREREARSRRWVPERGFASDRRRPMGRHRRAVSNGRGYVDVGTYMAGVEAIVELLPVTPVLQHDPELVISVSRWMHGGGSCTAVDFNRIFAAYCKFTKDDRFDLTDPDNPTPRGPQRAWWDDVDIDNFDVDDAEDDEVEDDDGSDRDDVEDMEEDDDGEDDDDEDDDVEEEEDDGEDDDGEDDDVEEEEDDSGDNYRDVDDDVDEGDSDRDAEDDDNDEARVYLRPAFLDVVDPFFASIEYGMTHHGGPLTATAKEDDGRPKRPALDEAGAGDQGVGAIDEAGVGDQGVGAMSTAKASPVQIARAARRAAWLRVHGPGLPDLTPRGALGPAERGSQLLREPSIDDGDSPLRRSD
ncbi:MAG: hypothetical protein R3B09_29050 [Nannocystaceae bacterium]